ncbi:MAG: DUF1569 domain-containing protein [Cyclobacteriaceae bacterium]
MKRSIFEPSTLDEILSRIQKLTPNSHGRWGRLTSEQMIRHLNMACQMSFGEVVVADRSNFITRSVVKWLFLSNIKPPGREKGKIQTFPEVDIVSLKLHVEDLNKERADYQAVLRRLVKTEILVLKHPLFGTMSRNDWGFLCYAHADYHLTQFGV